MGEMRNVNKISRVPDGKRPFFETWSRGGGLVHAVTSLRHFLQQLTDYCLLKKEDRNT
jgi:hypothetical protein